MIRKIKTNQSGPAWLSTSDRSSSHRSQSGLTYIELLIAIGVIAILSAISITYIRSNAQEDVRRATEQLASDIRLARNMSISRTTYDFGAGPVYPEGGYGIYFNDPATADQLSYYILYAGVGANGFDINVDKVIKRVDLPKTRLEINDINSTAAAFYFAFSTENSISTNLTKDSQSRYIIEILDPCVLQSTNSFCQTGYRGIINLGEESGDQYTLSNIGVSYNAILYPLPPPPPPDPKGTRGLVPVLEGEL